MDLFEKCQGFYSDPKYAQKYGYPTNPRTAQMLGLYPISSPSSTPRDRRPLSTAASTS
jgi:hypothetical protein